MSGETKHTTHCRARQRWGDGECDCDMRFQAMECKAAIELDGIEVSLRRTAACVSACAGISTEALEDGALSLAVATLHLVHECMPDAKAVEQALRALGRLR